jgi:hypothetical protein
MTDLTDIINSLQARLARLECKHHLQMSPAIRKGTSPPARIGAPLLGTHTHTTPDPDLFIQYDKNTGPRGNSTVFIVQLEMNDVERYHTCKFSFALFMPGFNRQKTDRMWTTDDAEVFVKDHFTSILAFAVQHTTDEEKRKTLHKFKGFDDCIVDISCQFPVYGDESVTRVGIALGSIDLTWDD